MGKYRYKRCLYNNSVGGNPVKRRKLEIEKMADYSNAKEQEFWRKNRERQIKEDDKKKKINDLAVSDKKIQIKEAALKKAINCKEKK